LRMERSSSTKASAMFILGSKSKRTMYDKTR
jgi:hypothetical protein